MSFQRFRVSTTSTAPTVQTLFSTSAGPSTSASPTSAGGPAGGHFQGVSFRVHFPEGLAPRAPSDPDAANADGGPDDFRRYTHHFPHLQAFQEWRAAEELERTVEFVLSDRHTSKANPPRFKEHVKLVCGRHGKNGRKKYEKKYPTRKRRWESLKIEGDGCPASITYKTFEGTDEVRAIYVADHSHPTGDENLPFTKKGRKLLTAKGTSKRSEEDRHKSTESPSAEFAPPEPIGSQTSPLVVGPTTFSVPLHFPQGLSHTASPHAHLSSEQGRTPSFNVLPFLSAPPSTFSLPAHHYLHDTPSSASSSLVEDNGDPWDRLGTLFTSVREAARSGFTFPPASVAALEAVLVRLYVESPVVAPPSALGGPGHAHSHTHHHSSLLPLGVGLPPAVTQVMPPLEPVTPRTPESPIRERLEEEESEYTSLSVE